MRRNNQAIPRSRYRVMSHAPGFVVKGPGVKVRVFNETIDTAVMLRDALDLAFAAGRRRR